MHSEAARTTGCLIFCLLNTAMHDFYFNHHFITVTSAIVIAVMAVVLIGIPIPHNGKWKRMRQMRAFLVSSYLLLSVTNMVHGLSDIESRNPALLSSITLVVASFQALLFTATAMVFIVPMRVRAKVITRHCCMIAAAGATLIFSAFSTPEIHTALFWLGVFAYLSQLVGYWQMFHTNYAHCAKQVDDYYDDDESGRLVWVRIFFRSALATGVIALAFSVFPVTTTACDWFTVTFTAYYVYVVMCIVNYRIGYTFVVNAVTTPVIPAPQETKEAKTCSKEQNNPQQPSNAATSQDDEQLHQLEQELQHWVQEKKYTQKDVTPDDIAEQLGTNRRYLAWYFTTQLHTTFRSWRLKLRIAEAERLLREDGEVSTASLHDLVGVGDKSNFHKQFKLATGLTPSEYKAQHGRPTAQ